MQPIDMRRWQALILLQLLLGAGAQPYIGRDADGNVVLQAPANASIILNGVDIMDRLTELQAQVAASNPLQGPAPGSIFVAGGYAAEKYMTAAAMWLDSSGIWRPTTPMSQPRAWHAMAWNPAMDQPCVIGGQGFDGPIGTVECYDLALRRWHAPAHIDPMPTPRSQAMIAAQGVEIFVVGGVTAGGQPSALAHVLNLTTGHWTELPSLPVPRARGTAGFANNTLIVAGGNEPSKGSVATTLYLHPQQARWLAGPALPILTEGLAGTTVAKGFVVVGGSSYLTSNANAQLLNSPSDPRWSGLPFLKIPLDFHALITMPDGAVVVLGGMKITPQATTHSAWSFRLAPSGKQWVYHSSLPGPLYACASMALPA